MTNPNSESQTASVFDSIGAAQVAGQASAGSFAGGLSAGAAPAIADPTRDVQMHVEGTPPQVIAGEQNQVGDVGDWARWGTLGAVAAGAAAVSPRLPQVQLPLRHMLEDRLRNVAAPGSVTSPAPVPGKVQQVKGAASKSSSVIKNFGSNVVGKAKGSGSRSLRLIGHVGSGSAKVAGTGARVASAAVTRAAGTTAGKKLAMVGARIGLRLAPFAIPGPGWAIGAAVLAGTWLFDKDGRRMVNNLIGSILGKTNSPAIDAPPSPPETYFLPLTRDGDRDNIIRAKDATMTRAHNEVFGFDPGKAWHPMTPEIETTSDFSATRADLAAAAESARTLIAEIESGLQRFGEQEYVRTAHEGMRPALERVDALASEVLDGVNAHIGALAQDFNTMYQELRAANVSARQEIADSGAGLLPWTASVDSAAMGDLSGPLTTFANAQMARDSALSQLITGWTSATEIATSGPMDRAAFGGGVGGAAGDSPKAQDVESEKSPDKDSGTTGAGGNTGTGSGGSTGSGSSWNGPGTTGNTGGPSSTGSGTGGGKSQQEILDALKSAGQAPPTAQTSAPQDPFTSLAGQMANPLSQLMNRAAQGQMAPQVNPMGAMGGMGAMNPLGGLGQTPAGSGSIASQIKDALDERDKKAVAEGKDKVKEDEAVTLGEEKDEKAGAAEGVEVSAPAAGVPSGAPDAAVADKGSESGAPEGGEAAKDPLAPGEVTPVGAPELKSAEVGGVKAEFDDPRLARMAAAMAPTDGSQPVTVHQAAAEAGYTLPPVGEDIGKRISVAEMKPGDLVMGSGDRNGMYWGDNKVLHQGALIPVGDIADFKGPHEGVFRVEGGDAPASATQQVSAPATPVVESVDPPAAEPAPAGDVAPKTDADLEAERKAESGDDPLAGFSLDPGIPASAPFGEGDDTAGPAPRIPVGD